MNILMLATHLNTGGISRYILTLAKGLKEKGHNVYVATSGGDMVKELETLGARHVPITIRRAKSELDIRIYWAAGRLKRLVREEKIDIIHAHTRVTQIMGCLVSRSTGRPCVSTCHGFFKKRLVRKIFPAWGRAVVAISPPVKEHLINDLGVPIQKIFLIPNGVDAKDFPLVTSQMRSARRHELGLGSQPIIGIIARLSEVKGHSVLLEAMKKVIIKLPSAKLMIVGQGDLKEKLEQQVRRLGLENNILFYPVVNQTAKMLAAIDVFVMPSLQEGLGLSVMEAQVSGLPVVASNVGGIPSLIEDGGTGLLVPPKEPNILAAAIVMVIENPKLAQKMGLAGREFVLREFSAEKMTTETIHMYETAIREVER